MLCTFFSPANVGLCCSCQNQTQIPATVKGINESGGGGGGGDKKKKRDVRNSWADKWIDRDGWVEPGMKPIQKQTEDKKDLW